MQSHLTGWLTFIFTFTILNCLFAQTDQWRLSWDMNSENDITGYKIYRYTSTQHNQIDDSLYATVPHSINTDSSEVNQGDSTITFFDRHLRPGVLFHYRVKAVNNESLESNYSDYVSAAIPQISTIPSLVINEGQSFPILDLDNYVSDRDNSDGEITWTASGQSALNVSINTTNHNLTVTVPNPDWNGSDTFTLTATDPGGFWNSTQVIFKVNPVDENPTEEGPTIAGSGQFKNLSLIDTTIVMTEDVPSLCPDSSWFNFVEDGDTEDSELTYSISESRYIQITDTEKGKILTPVINFCRKDRLKLIVSDGIRADSAYFLIDVCAVNDAPEKSKAIKPNHNSFVEQSDSLVFEWSPSFDPDSEAVYYDLTIREEDGFNEIHIIDIEATKFKLYIPAGFEPGEFYSWYITSKDGSTEVVSDTSVFYVVPSSSNLDNPWNSGPLTYQLGQNFPNPFNPTTEIQYMLADAGHVTIEVFNTLGQRVSRLVDEFKDAGQYIVDFDSQGLSSGIYFYHIRTNDFHDIRKMILRK